MTCSKLAVTLGVLLSATVFASAQSAPDLENGFKAYGSYDGSNLDSINVENGNLMLHIPLPSTYPQRGGKLNPKSLLTVSSKQWQVTCVNNPDGGQNCFWAFGGTGVQVAAAGSGVGFDDTMDLAVHRTTITETDAEGSTLYSSFVDSVNTADGAQHSMANGAAGGGGDPNGNATAYEASDTSGFRVDLSNFDPTTGFATTLVLTDRHGNRYPLRQGASHCSHVTEGGGNNGGGTTTITCEYAFVPLSMTDVNGNTFLRRTPNGSQATVDTMGRSSTAGLFTSATQSSDPTGCALAGLPFSSATIFAYLGPSGASQQIKACYGSATISTAFGQSGVNEAGSGIPPIISMPVLTSVTMPDSSQWIFQYDSYGNVTFVGLPIGGSISYTWQTVSISPSCSMTRFSRAVSSRTVNDNNGHSFIWNYKWGTLTNNTLANTVTDALGNDTVHTFTALQKNCQGIYETTTQEYQGTGTSRTLLKETDTNYASFEGMYDVVPTSIQTTVYPSGKVSLVTKQYDPGNIFADVTQEKDYDWGQGSPGALLRESDTTYVWQNDSRYLLANILDLPASVVVKDGSGCALSETDYTYDESNYLTSYEGTVGSLPTGTHVAAPDPVSGNLTTVTRWLAPTSSCNPKGGTSVVTHTNWYNTGEAYLQIDALLNTTTHLYDLAYAGAYSTETCQPPTNGVNHCVSGTYDFTTGLLTSFTNENATSQASGATPGDSAHTTFYSYDIMARLTSAVFPPDPNNGGAQAQTKFNYPIPITLPFTVTRTKSVTPGLTDSVTSTYDGLGRVYKTQHPLPNGTAEVDTVYDGLDHVISVTNPYFSTSDPTYGKIQTQYDALGRVTQVTDQDGSTRSVSYNVTPMSGVLGDCTVSTDEAGHQRKNCDDGLGRLVEVDEPNPGAPATYATGSVTISGTEQQATTAPAQSASVSVAIGGSNNSNTETICGPKSCRTITIPDSGTVSFTIAAEGTTIGPVSTSYPPAAGTTLAGNLYQNFPSNSLVSVGNLSSSGFTLTATPGAAGNSFVISTSVVSGCVNTDTITCGGPGYFMTPGSANFTGGLNAAVTPDTGTVTATVGGNNYTVSYGGSDTSSTIATNLASAISSGSLANASPSGGTITLNAKTSGPGEDFSLTASYTWNSSQFTNPSFTTSTSGSTFTGGYNAGDPANRPFVTQYGYDGLGNLLSVTQKGDPTVTNSSQWRVRNFTYDTLSRLLTAQNPESGTINYSYDADGNLLQKTSPAPNSQVGSGATQAISYCYDALNRVTGKAYSAQSCPLSSPVVTYAYDSGANAIGKLTSLTDQAGSGSYAYDILGRMSGETRVIAGVTKSMSYTYNVDGSLKTLTNPSGAVITYTPWNNGTIAAAGVDQSAADSGNGINYVGSGSYGPDLSITGFTSGQSSGFSGVTNSFTYNNRLQPVTMSAASPSATVFSLTYDFHKGAGDNGNVFAITNNKDSSRNQSFTYDLLNRLTSAQNAGTNCSAVTVNGKTEYWGNSYGYDAWGNLLQKVVTKCSAENLSVSVSPQANNQLVGYGYDAAGNMTSDPTDGVTATYDPENRILTANGATTYTYDADGNRVEKSSGGTGTLYWYMSPGIVAESDLSGNLKSEYVFFDGERVARRDGPNGSGGVFYYFSDHLKTTDIVTNATGTILNESDFYPWGGELEFSANDSNHYKFTGKERDTETGLDYFGARYYSNGLGRFITPDWAAKATAVAYAEFSDPQSLNLYSYVRNIPTSKADADGHCPPCGVEEETGIIMDEEALGSPATGTVLVETTAAAAEAGGGAVLLTTVGMVAIDAVGVALITHELVSPSQTVGQSDADERAAMQKASVERAAQNGGVDPQAQPSPEAQGDVEGKRKNSSTIRRGWEKAKGKKWPKDKDGKNYDADHKKALADGGTNNPARNIQPLTHKDHVQRHKDKGDFKRWAKRHKKKR